MCICSTVVFDVLEAMMATTNSFIARNTEEGVLIVLTLSPLALELTGIPGCSGVRHLSSF